MSKKPKQMKLVDDKMEKVVSIIAQASEEIRIWSDDALLLIQKINTSTSQLNNDLAQETITEEDAVVRYEKEAGRSYRSLHHRIKRMTKNTKAMSGLLSAIKAMQDEEDKQ